MPPEIEQKILVSTVTPVYSGADYLKRLVGYLEELKNKWHATGAPMQLGEAIFVDDAANDGSPELLDALSKEHEWITVIHLSRNFGQHPATIAGILHASGDWIVTLDEDLQHRPENIDQLFEKVSEESCDIVYARPNTAVHENAKRDLGSRLFKKLMGKITGNRNIPYFNSFRLIRGSVARAAASVCSHETYFDMALSWFSERVGLVQMPLKDERVIEGKSSGYSYRRLLSHARRMAISTHSKFMRWGAIIGFATVFLAIFYAAKIVAQKYIAPETIPVRGWASLFIAILFFSGIISLLIGALLEYLSVIVLHIQGKPTFFVVDRSSDLIIRNYYSSSKYDST